MEVILNKYKIKFPTLDDSEIVKMLIAKGDQLENTYEQSIKELRKAKAQKLFNTISDRVNEGFVEYTVKNSIDTDKLTEEEIYEILSKI